MSNLIAPPNHRNCSNARKFSTIRIKTKRQGQEIESSCSEALLCQVVINDEKGICYDNQKNPVVISMAIPAFKDTVYWVRCSIYYELLKPNETITRDRTDYN
ncbi:hypothetical protein TNCV_4285291 [Trichonephila clavipes]|nr:hypothetical protein TNCV_4285291 [Trichonephila clavipes]